MRRPLFLLFVNAAICLIVLMMLVQSVAVLQLLAVADVLNGTVEASSGATNPFHLLHQGDVIRTGDTIRSGADGTAEFRWIDGTRLRLEPNSEITIRHYSLNLKRHAQNSEFALARGKVFVRIPQKLSENSRFAIVTPGATTNVRGTIFSVTANEGETEVAVWKGSVDVADAKNVQQQAVPAGELLSAGEGTWHLFDAHSRLAQNATRDFRPLTNIVTPSLEARLLLSEMVHRAPKTARQSGLLLGQAEAGDRVFVNGQEMTVRGDGGFSARVTLQNGANLFTLTAIDRHQATRTVRLNAELPMPGSSLSSSK